MDKYDKGKVKQILLDEYHKAYGTGGNPSTSLLKLLDCMDDAFIDEYIKAISGIEDEIKQEAASVQLRARNTIAELEASIEKSEKASEEAKRAEVIHDERVVDALKAYQTIVNMDFDTPQQKLQNIQNASYFIWALYAKESSTASMFLKAVTDVKNEDDSKHRNTSNFKKMDSRYNVPIT